MSIISHPARLCVVTPRPQQIRTGGNAQPLRRSQTHRAAIGESRPYRHQTPPGQREVKDGKAQKKPSETLQEPCIPAVLSPRRCLT